MPEANELTKLIALISEHFSADELRELCLEMGIYYEHLSGDNVRARALSLVERAKREGRLLELQEQVARQRPHLAEGIAAGRASTKLHHIPYLQNPLFTGREDWLNALHTQLGQQSTVAVTQAVAGLGGVGKTQLALEYCYRHVAEYDLIYWLRADEAATLAGEMAELAYRLGAAPRTVTDQNTLRGAALDWLHGTARRWLLIFDNVDELEPADLQPYLPRVGNGGCLITSRNERWQGLAHTLRLDGLPPDEAVTFLRQARPDAPDADAAQLAQVLGYLPLALEHARAFVAATGCTLADYAHYLETAWQELWAAAEAPLAYDRRTITTTWEVAFARARQTPGAAALLNLCCFLDPEGIPLALLRQAAETPGFLEKPGVLSLETALKELGRYSLVQREGEMVRLHRLVQTVARDQMPPEIGHNTLAMAVNLLAEAWPYDEQDMDTWPASADLLPHLLAVADWAERADTIPANIGFLWNKTGLYLSDRGIYALARDCFQRALSIDEKAFGINHLDVAGDLNNMGMVLQISGDLAGARSCYERSLVIVENMLGEDDLRVATLDNNLGTLLYELGDLAGARPYFERALSVTEKVFGPHHPRVAASNSNLGLLLKKSGDLARAWSYYKYALDIDEKALGPDHPSVARDMNNLGMLLQAEGDLAGARPYLERALAIWEQALGPDHPQVATGSNNLGLLLQAEGDLAGARPYLERALAIWEKGLGADHPQVALGNNNLGLLLQAEGDLAGARPYLERALAIDEKALGADHPDVATDLNNLGMLLQAEGDLAGARPYLKRALAMFEKILGADHPNLATLNNNLGLLLQAEGDLAGARVHLERALAILEARLGPEHPHTRTARNNLAGL